MSDLTKYFPKQVLDLCWDMRNEIEVIRGKKTDVHAVQIQPRGPLAHHMIVESGMPEAEIAPVALAYKSLGEFMENGPIIIRPSLELCMALHDTEIRVPTTEFVMPFPVMGIELPKEVVGKHHGSLTMVWKMFPDTVMIWTTSVANWITYHTMIGDDLETIEDRLILAEGCDDEDEFNLQIVGGRIAANLCMLATARKAAVTPLPRKTAKHRAGKDERLKRLASREMQAITFRDLILRDRPSAVGSGTPTFATRGPQRRRGHWKRVAHGPKFSKRTWRWINDYWTGDGDDEAKPTIVLR